MTRPPDPMDELMSGDVSRAVEAYARLVADAVEQGDIAMVSDLFMQLEVSLASWTRGLWPEAVEDEAEKMVRDVLSRRPHATTVDASTPVDKLIADGKALARENLERARKRAQKSIDDVEKDKVERWSGTE
jgi:hypothetical protein